MPRYHVWTIQTLDAPLPCMDNPNIRCPRYHVWTIQTLDAPLPCMDNPNIRCPVTMCVSGVYCYEENLFLAVFWLFIKNVLLTKCEIHKTSHYSYTFCNANKLSKLFSKYFNEHSESNTCPVPGPEVLSSIVFVEMGQPKQCSHMNCNYCNTLIIRLTLFLRDHHSWFIQRGNLLSPSGFSSRGLINDQVQTVNSWLHFIQPSRHRHNTLTNLH